MQHSRRISLSSPFLQASLWLSLLCCILWLVATLATWIYKGLALPYPAHFAWPGELLLMLCLVGLEYLSLKNASKGNLLEFRGPLFVAFLISSLQTAGIMYFLRFQPYVLKLDLYFSAVFIGGKGISAIFVVAQLLSLSSSAGLQTL